MTAEIEQSVSLGDASGNAWWQLSLENSTGVVVFLLLFPLWNEELCPVAAFLLRSFYWFQKFEFTSVFSVWGSNSPLPLERSEPVFSRFVFRGSPWLSWHRTLAWIAAISKFNSGLSCSGTEGAPAQSHCK